MKIVISILRALQILVSVVVLALSITLAKGQNIGSVPATTSYSAFAGAFGILVGIIGITSLFIESLHGIIIYIADALGALILLAGGIAFVIGLKGTNCGNAETTYLNPLLNCGASTKNDHKKEYFLYCDGKDEYKRLETINSRCRRATADDAFLFMAFVVTLAVLGLSFFAGRKRVSGSYVV